MVQSSQAGYQEAAQQINQLYRQGAGEEAPRLAEQLLKTYHRAEMRNYILSLGLTLVGFRVLLASYSLLNRRELESERTLKEVTIKAFTDKLTGAQSINAYRDREYEINRRIRTGSTAPFALLVCDVNDLKLVNDKSGHQAGDAYLCQAFRQLKSTFPNSPVYRVGGDEFVVLLEGEDYRRREALLEELEKLNCQTGNVRVAAGMSDWQQGKDELAANVFARADIVMYKRKSEMKKAAR